MIDHLLLVVVCKQQDNCFLYLFFYSLNERSVLHLLHCIFHAFKAFFLYIGNINTKLTQTTCTIVFLVFCEEAQMQ